MVGTYSRTVNKLLRRQRSVVLVIRVLAESESELNRCSGCESVAGSTGFLVFHRRQFGGWDYASEVVAFRRSLCEARSVEFLELILRAQIARSGFHQVLGDEFLLGEVGELVETCPVPIWV